MVSGLLYGFLLYLGFFLLKAILVGFYTVKPDERAVISSFGRAQRLSGEVRDADLDTAEKERYRYPKLKVKRPGGPYFKWPWQSLHKVSVATQAVDIVWDPTKSQSTIEAVTKDNLTTGVNGQIRYQVSENNLYPFFFGVESPLEHIMGFFVSVMRERIANFTDPKGAEGLISQVESTNGEAPSLVDISEGVSINDLRKNLPLLNQYMEEQCKATGGRYGIDLDAALITTIDPPPEVDRALSAINSTRNQVAADISTARADSEQQITMSSRAVEIALNEAKAEVAPLKELSTTLHNIKAAGGSSALQAYLRNMRVPLYKRATRIIDCPGEQSGLKVGGLK